LQSSVTELVHGSSLPKNSMVMRVNEEIEQFKRQTVRERQLSPRTITASHPLSTRASAEAAHGPLMSAHCSE
jgi:hypothetical protein